MEEPGAGALVERLYQPERLVRCGWPERDLAIEWRPAQQAGNGSPYG